MSRNLLVLIAVWVAVALAAVAGVSVLAWWALGAPALQRPETLTPKGINEIATRAFAVVAGVGGVALLVISYYKQGTEDTRLFTERFTTAAGQLGEDAAKPAVRLAGVHALAHLADDAPSTALRQMCIDVLCAYLRMPYDPEPTDPGADADPQQAKDYRAERLAFASLREVRHTIIRTIGNRLRANTPWRGHDFDFTGTVFDGGDFARAVFSGGTASFKGAVFPRGVVDFTGAMFSGGAVDFSGAVFSGGEVSFDGSAFTAGMVSFADVEVTAGEVGLSRTVFSGGTVSFTRAEFSGGKVLFAGALFTGGKALFSKVEFIGSTVSFSRAALSGGTVDFTEAEFSGGAVSFTMTLLGDGRLDFLAAKFSGAEVDFSRAHFLEVEADFSGVRFAGGVVLFDRSDFIGGQLKFFNAEFLSGEVSFARTAFTGTAVDFHVARFSDGVVSFAGAAFSGGSVSFAVDPWDAETLLGACPEGLVEQAAAGAPGVVVLPSVWRTPESGDGAETAGE